MKTFTIYAIMLICVLRLNAQNLNSEITTNGQNPYLLGKIDKSGLEGENYNSWFIENYENYQPNPALISSIVTEIKPYSITLFMGTWCGDSKNEVPKLYKILETANFPMNQLTVIAVSRQPSMYKQSPNHEEEGLNIHRVPTAIFYKDGKEVNRIVEHPVNSFEEDILNIITINDYRSNYEIVTVIDNILKTKGVNGLSKKSKRLLKSYGQRVTSMYELNTYARILYGINRTEEAIAVFNFNTKLFPNEARVYMSLANTLGVSGQKEKAVKVLEDAIKQLPKNKDLKENLAMLKSN